MFREFLMEDKLNILVSFKIFDEGNLKFFRTELLLFLKFVDNEVREFATDFNLRKYFFKFLIMS